MVIPSFYIIDNELPKGEQPAPQVCTDGLGGTAFQPVSSSGRENYREEACANLPSVPSPGLGKADEEPRSGWRETEIITNLFLGDLQDAGRFDGMIISVLPDAMADEPRRTIRFPFLANGRATLDTTSALIDAGLRLGMPVLVHCEEGCERAPLAIAWFLMTRRGMTLDEAYALIKSRRPIVKDRRAWLGIYNR
jgi:hypothetical protein